MMKKNIHFQWLILGFLILSQGFTQWNEVSVDDSIIKLNEISILEDGVAYVAVGGALNSIPEGGVLKTLDYGQSWQLLTCPAADNGISMVTTSFRDQFTGFVGGSNVMNMRTLDGGTSWTYNSFDTPESIRRVRWLNDSTAIVMDKKGKLFTSRNTGETWEMNSALNDILPSIHNNASTMALEIIDEYNWIAAGKKGALVSTSNGGQSWGVLIHSAGTPVFQDIDAFDVNNWTVVGTNGTALMTHNGGQNFIDLNLDPNNSAKYQAVSYADSSNIMIGGITVSSSGYGVIHSSSDGGQTWEDESFGGNDIYGFSIRDIYMYEPGLAIAIGDANPGAKVFLLGQHIFFGDVNADSLLDVLDLQRLMEIVSQSGIPANEDELLIIDMNRDLSYDVLDAVLLVEAVMDFNESPDSTSRSSNSVGSTYSDASSHNGYSVSQTKGHRMKRIFANRLRKFNI
ncbi:MAG: hypothetical protein HOD43_09065 [Candidatus Marinimicrobia bacterium]|jgi:photosystem II stability/assembly factor-like uncharacterized protein|nr:hypothetical protein [Candidatus Neomarinimicrobiota bacterium]MBT3823604.1 hypothetical protein [Candidatus Neomarinimicrobiota bacterium]MBT4129537.1 hypothetical protein [Candidatus Neomarinimicrobiota bacterium]MBT4295937.1 hypothetical protein [Candidatus Neomarinimicrobiota bacterium]MBT4420061.1 hypothetical protein [Candidatus Neomarinimicrobiota bacterium]